MSNRRERWAKWLDDWALIVLPVLLVVFAGVVTALSYRA